MLALFSVVHEAVTELETNADSFNQEKENFLSLFPSINRNQWITFDILTNVNPQNRPRFFTDK